MLGPFTAAQAAAAGLTEATLRSRAVRREHHGAYVPADLEPSLELSVAAARLVLPADALLDGLSALHALGVDVGDRRPLRFVSVHPHQVRRPGVRVRRVGTLPPTALGGSSVSAETAFVGAAQELDLVELVAAGDWLVQLGHSSPAALTSAAGASRRSTPSSSPVAARSAVSTCSSAAGGSRSSTRATSTGRIRGSGTSTSDVRNSSRPTAVPSSG